MPTATDTARYAPWPLLWPHTTVRLAVGVLLALAAILNMQAAWTGAAGEVGPLSDPRWVGMLLATAELILAALLLAGVWPRLIHCAVIVCFAAFACVTAFEAGNGAASCGCFGDLQVDPRLTLILDFVCLVSLVAAPPPVAAGTKPPLAARVSAVAVLIVVLVLSTTESHPIRRLSGDHIPASWNAGELVLADASDWVGRFVPILREVDVGESLRRGRWVIVLYHFDCHTCQEAVPFYARLARSLAARGASIHIALIAVPPYGPLGQGTNAGSPHVLNGRLSQRFDWFIKSPTALATANGILLAQSSGDAVLTPQW